MRARTLALITAAATALSVAAVPVAASPLGTAGPGPGHFSSDNVEWLTVSPLHTGSSGGRLHEGHFYVTDPRGVYIYDVEDPAAPALTGFVNVFQSGTMAALAQEDPDTNGEILLVDAIDPDGDGTNPQLLVIDVSDKTAPAVIGAAAVTDHTWTCVADCTYAYGRTGYIVDLTDPENPTVAGNWKSTVSGSGYTHDFTEVGPNRLMSSGQPSFYLDVTDPLQPQELTRIATKFSSLGYHSNMWPQQGTDPMLIAGTEIAPPGTTNLAGSDCQGDGEIATYDATEVLAAEAHKEEFPEEPWGPAEFVKLDAWRIAGTGTYQDGHAPFHTLYCSHWFDPHPQWDGGGLVAAAHYDWGTRFLEVDTGGQIEEIGWFQPVGGYTASAYWITDDIVYTLDYRRGLDILRINAD